jgi:hypothetical protein
MRYFPLLFLLPFSVSLPLLPVFAAEFPTLVVPSLSSPDFWPQAQQLVQEQLNLIDRIEQAIASPDYSQVEGVRGELIRHSGAVESFLNNQYRIPRFLCINGTNLPDPNVAADLTVPQRQVYCALSASMERLQPVVLQLERRLSMLADITPPNTLPSAYDPLLRSPVNFPNPVPPTDVSVPDLEVPEPPVIGLPAKTAIADALPFQPAILPLKETTIALKAAREQLLPALAAFPTSIQIIDPVQTREISDRSTYGLLPSDSQEYANFLAQPNTGIARVLPAEAYRFDPIQLRNRLQPTVAERFPFVPLGKSISGLTPRFAIKITEGNFQISLSGLNYGFMANLGEVSLEDLDATLKNISTLSPQQRGFFLNYFPPDELVVLQEDRLRFFTGKEAQGFVPAPSFLHISVDSHRAAFSAIDLPVSAQAPAVLNNTYLLRLFQFQLSEVILQRQSISGAQRRQLNRILQTPSSDVLVAFRPVKQLSDGSYTVVWRLLKQFPDPQIIDLHKYLYFE